MPPDFSTPPCVIITPVRTSRFYETRFNVITPVCVARDVTTKGFRLAARNTDPDFSGSSAFNWIAIHECPGLSGPVPAVDYGFLPPQYLAPSRESFFGNRTFHDSVYYSLPQQPRFLDTKVASVQLTATDKNMDMQAFLL